ncbi:single-stranded DNA-binding protein [Nonomuraea salmonea]|uniref:single-stranded DNA-binding protein n=1 Tax=Nonomuraea salmonea TaxID=46181 RepID=UPI002FEAD5BF
MANDITLTITGNLTDDPELRFTPTGEAVARFRIASSPRYLDRHTGEWKDGRPLYLTCNVWRQQAEHVAESLQRGMRVIVEGRLKQRTYETSEGDKRTVYELEVIEAGPSLRNATATVTPRQERPDGHARTYRGPVGRHLPRAPRTRTRHHGLRLLTASVGRNATPLRPPTTKDTAHAPRCLDPTRSPPWLDGHHRRRPPRSPSSATPGTSLSPSPAWSREPPSSPAPASAKPAPSTSAGSTRCYERVPRTSPSTPPKRSWADAATAPNLRARSRGSGRALARGVWGLAAPDPAPRAGRPPTGRATPHRTRRPARPPRPPRDPQAARDDVWGPPSHER